MAKQKKEKQKSTFWKDFKAFISRGNIIDLAVGLVVGAAFTAIVNSLVNDIIKPLIALLVGGNLSELAVILRPEEVNEAGDIVEAITLNYGNLIMAILTFLIDAFVIFTAVRIVRNVQRRIREESEKLKLKLTQKENGETVETEAVVEEQAPAAPAEPPKPTVEELLAEIRDLLRENKAASAADLAESAGKPEEKK